MFPAMQVSEGNNGLYKEGGTWNNEIAKTTNYKQPLSILPHLLSHLDKSVGNPVS